MTFDPDPCRLPGYGDDERGEFALSEDEYNVVAAYVDHLRQLGYTIVRGDEP